MSVIASRKSQRIAKRYKRALETTAETINRQEQNRANMVQKRALESPSDTLCRQEESRTCMAKKRSMNVSVDQAVSIFLSKAKMGPDFVCTSCH